jgi:AraC-like DNA-binding protein
MFARESDLSCGIFDSTILRKNQLQTTPRTVTQYELEIFHTDTGKSYVGEQSQEVRRGMLLFAKPGMIRKSDLPVRCGFIRISPEAAEREGIAPLLSSLPSYIYIENEEKTDEMIALFSKLAAHMIDATSDTVSNVRINALFLDILYRLHRICSRIPEQRLSKPVSNMLHNAREYINEHFTESCSLRDIAEAVNISPNYLHTIFHTTFGETPYGYVTRKRIDKAKKLIMAGQHSMLDIAIETGFCSQSHFNKVFKSQTGITPKQFRDGFSDEY